jgi:hypothetical protein
MNLDLTEEETAALLTELDDIIDADRYFLSQRIRTVKADPLENQTGAAEGVSPFGGVGA